MENILFSIGDYSTDGHSYCADLIVQSNKTVGELREIHLKGNHFIGHMCSEYEDTNVSIPFLYDFLQEYKSQEDSIKAIKLFIKENKLETSNFEDEDAVLTDESFENLSFNDFEINFENKPKELLELWLFLLKTIDNSFSYKVLTEPLSRYYLKYKGYPFNVDDNFISSRKYKRNLEVDTPGYGIWNDRSDSEFYMGD